MLTREPHVLATLAEAYLGSGEQHLARETAEEAVSLAHERGVLAVALRAHLALARVRLQTEGANAATAIETTLARAMTLVEQTGAKSQEPFIHVELAELARLRGDEARRQRELRAAHRRFTDMGAMGHAERLERTWPQLSGARS